MPIFPMIPQRAIWPALLLIPVHPPLRMRPVTVIVPVELEYGGQQTGGGSLTPPVYPLVAPCPFYLFPDLFPFRTP